MFAGFLVEEDDGTRTHDAWLGKLAMPPKPSPEVAQGVFRESELHHARENEKRP